MKKVDEPRLGCYSIYENEKCGVRMSYRYRTDLSGTRTLYKYDNDMNCVGHKILPDWADVTKFYMFPVSVWFDMSEDDYESVRVLISINNWDKSRNGY
jgi:hypothetical protein